MLTLLTACAEHEELPRSNAVYYWRTELRLDSLEKAFLSQHNIEKVYCRYFDVVMREDKPVPNATITFSDSLATGIEIIPVVYITEDCIHKAYPELAKQIVSRIIQMNETNDISGVKEVQIDCDYTLRSRQTYYNLLSDIRQQLTKHHIRLSTTIRLHQLSMPAPPADYGILMIYNTGDPQKFMERNPILDIRDVRPYLRYLSKYPLPLAATYPVYKWQRTVYGVRIDHSVEAQEILRVKQTVEHERPSLNRSIIAYHLDNSNILRYDEDFWHKLFGEPQ